MDFTLYLTALPILLMSVVVHEVAHALVAKWEGDDTAHRLGRITLNPILIWEAVSESETYTVQVSLSTDFSTMIVNQGGISGTSYALSSLSENTTYFWRVNAQNNEGVSEWSDTWNFTTTQTGNTVISTFTGTTEGRGINLTWQTTSEYENKGFDIESYHDKSNRWRTIGFVDGAGTSSTTQHYSFYDSKARKSGTYVYRLKQINNDGTYHYSAEITVIK